MMPWEKYAQDTAADAVGPWDKYKGAALAPAQSAAKVAPLDQLPPEQGGGNQPTVNADDIAHRILGVGEAGLSAATGALGGAAGQVYGIGKTLASGKFGTQAGIQEGEKAGVDLANKLTYQPRTQTGQNLVEGAGKALEASRLQGLPVEAGTLGRIGEVPRGALATGEGLADINSKIGRTVAAPAVAAGKAVANKLPAIDPETASLARDAHAMGFRLSPEQVYGSKYGKFAGELATENPFVKNNREHNQQTFNSQLVSAIGGAGNKLTKKVYDDAMKASGQTIGDIAAKTPLPVNPGFIGQLRSNAANQLPEVSGVVNSFVDQIDKLAGPPPKLPGGGRTAAVRELPGEAFRRINTAIGKRIRETGNGDLKSALGNLQDDLQQARSEHLSSKDRVAYDAARKFYAVGKQLEPLIAKSPTGDIPPAALLGALTATKAGKSAVARGAYGDLGKLADIGQKFLKSNPSSGTAERSFFQNLLTHPAGTLAAGATAAATAPVAAAYNRYSPSVTNALINRPPVP